MGLGWLCCFVEKSDRIGWLDRIGWIVSLYRWILLELDRNGWIVLAGFDWIIMDG